MSGIAAQEVKRHDPEYCGGSEVAQYVEDVEFLAQLALGGPAVRQYPEYRALQREVDAQLAYLQPYLARAARGFGCAACSEALGIAMGGEFDSHTAHIPPASAE